MASTWVRLFVHVVWSTWDRHPLITPEIESHLYRMIASQASRFQCEALAVNGVADHVHVVARLHPAVAVASLVRAMKSASSHLAHHELVADAPFRWQSGYGAVTIDRETVPVVANYVRDQKRHHANSRLVGVLESMPSPGADATE